MTTQSTSSATHCTIDIHIDCRGDVNIYNCSAPAKSVDPAAPCAEEPSSASCLPAIAGGKHKVSLEQKLARLLNGVRVPSAIATSILHTARRFLLGKSPQNPLEAAAFDSLRKMSRDTLSCAVATFSALPPAASRRLFAPALILGIDQAIDAAMLSAAFADELAQRVGLLVFGSRIAAEEERPGSIRVDDIGPESFFSLRICRVNDLRTTSYLPVLSPAEFLPSEIQQDCEPTFVDGQTQVICQVRVGDCKGNQIGGEVCARVPDVAAGDGMVLQGVNFFSLDATVRLTDRETATIVRHVPVHLWGDVETPVTEVVDGATRLINDCRVHDRLSFRVPDDLPPGFYGLQVVVPNITGIAALGTFITSNTETINVTPPPTARFQIVTETIYARKETSPAWAGSDEVGLHTIAVALLADGNFGSPQEQRFTDIQDVDFDSGTSRDITRVIFKHDQPIMGMALSVLGYEIDSQHAYDAQIHSSTAFFVELVKKQAEFVKDALGKLKENGIDVREFGWTGAALAAIAAGVTIVVDIITSFWAPADLIIQDSFGLTISDLAALTSANSPAPEPNSFQTEDGIVVNVNKTVVPLKLPFEYRETREYVSSEEESRYELTYRFNRTV